MAVDPGEFFSGYNYDPIILERDNYIDDAQTDLAKKLHDTFAALPKKDTIPLKLDRYVDEIFIAATRHIPRPLWATNIKATSSPFCGTFEMETVPDVPTIEGIRRGGFDYDGVDTKRTMDWGIVKVEYSPSVSDLKKNKDSCRSEIYLLNVALWGRNVLVNHNSSKHGLFVIPDHKETFLFEVKEGPGEIDEEDDEEDWGETPSRHEETVAVPRYHLRLMSGEKYDQLMELFHAGASALQPVPKKPVQPRAKTKALPSKQQRG
jgi:hypothetical protein